MSEPSWRRPLSGAEAAVVLTRYQQLAERWTTVFPTDPLPELTGDSVAQTRTVQLMAHRLRSRGERPEGGLIRGPGMEIADATLQQVKEQATTVPDEPDGDPSD